MKTKKIEIAKYLITENIKIFKCPICSEDMLLKENSLICLNSHCFDLSRKGYINFLINSASSKYDRQIFYSGKYIIKNSFFQPLIAEVINTILSKTKGKRVGDVVTILDVGC